MLASGDAVDVRAEATHSINAFDALLAEYRTLAPTERDKGNYFEGLVAQYLRHDSQMRSQFSTVYLWKDWPGRQGRSDCGIDLVAIPADDPQGAVAVQCKFYKPGHRIQKSDVDSFLSESGKAPFTRRIFVETTGVAWGANAEAAIQDQHVPVTRVGLTDLRNSDIDWSTYTLTRPDEDVQTQERKSLRDHQVAAIRDVFTGFETNDRGTLVMACGTGKTFTSLKIAERTAETNGGSARVLFMVPSLALMSQTLQEWSAECELPFSAWSVCSDSKVNKRQASADLLDMVVADLKIPATTDGASLAASLAQENEREGLQVVFSTYQSIQAVHEAQCAGGDDWRDFDLIICDEAHRTTGVTLTGEDESNFVRIHDNTYIRADKRLYMTATPRLFKDEVKNAAKEKDAILTSMDDTDTYGPVFHKLGFGQAVAMGLLTDYKVVVLAVPEEEVSGIYQAQTAQDGELSLPETAKLVGCWNALSKRRGKTHDIEYGSDLSPMRRAVAFCKDIKTSKWVTEEFATLVHDQLQDLTNDDDTDDLEIQCQHVDGSMNAVTRGEALDWLKADTTGEANPVCRILTNARCLSEGVDVPTLDAVLFLNPRKSHVDVIQAVGRVMRKAPGKEFGYIVLPVAVPLGATPESALADNKRYQVIWQVLQAIRAHDERFDATINSIEYNSKTPENIIVDVVDLTPTASRNSGDDHFSGEESGGESGGESPTASSTPPNKGTQMVITFPPEEWKDAVYSRIVKKVGSRLYWDDWSKDIADIANRYINLIEHLLEEQQHKDDFLYFVDALQQTLNPNIDNAQAVEMLAQHLITKPLFDAMFDDQQFTQQNPVSQAMQSIVDRLADNEVFEKERRPLEKFYTAMVERIKQVDNLAGKQQIMLTLFDKFFSKAFPNMADRLGIVFTPVEVVDYIIHSANDALQTAFGKTLGEPGVALIEPFVGTGTFVSRLLQSGLITPEQLEYKYKHEIFANEIVLLSYYIASINIESVYREIRKEQGHDNGYVEFEGISLTDTFQLYEADGTTLEDTPGFDENLERAKRQKQAPIRVIMMNPPYSAGQTSANDNNQNLKYPVLDQRIEDTYANKSTGTNKNSLYDSYYRALRWATDRIGDHGIIAFVSNNSFIDGNTADGVRLTWQNEFSDIFIYNLRGGVRGKMGETAKLEGGNVFNIMTGVAITVLVKTKHHIGPATIHYAEIADYATRQEKLDTLTRQASLSGTDFQIIKPNEAGDWINQRDEKYVTYQPIGDKTTKGKEHTQGIFRNYSGGLKTNRDAWCYNFSHDAVATNIERMISNYNAEVQAGSTSKTVDTDPNRVSWNRQLFKDLDKKLVHRFNFESLIQAIYRPFCKHTVYFNRTMNDMVYQLPQLFPTPAHRNIGITTTGDYRKNWSHLAVAEIPDLNILSASIFFSLFTWEKQESPAEGELDLFGDTVTNVDDEFAPSAPFDFSRPIGEQIPQQLDGYARRDNITDATLRAYRQHYQDQSIGKEDIFFYIYALLHHPDYRSRYEADLKKMLPRIPKCLEFWEYANSGRELADLHVNYEQVEPYSLIEDWKLDVPKDLSQRYQVTKPTWLKRTERTSLKYNEYLTLHGIPEAAQDYQVNGRSPLDWVVDRYRVTVDKKSGIRNDPNDYCLEIGKPDYIVDLIKRLVTVSLETQKIVSQLPTFEITEK
ncbi:DEAD/DEAH box helicase family protein [Actinomycetaceae bacterium TAE3-ERU4]|nr:DEAD/DEAH box helicase family protein [Actinomycetaceae bacterium TAE3-ERU4]